MLSLRRVCKSYHDGRDSIAVLNDVSLDLLPGETLALMGESGAGKSTLLHLCAGLDQADSGKIVVGGDDLGALDDRALARFRRRHLGVVFQQYNLIPTLSVSDNITFVRRLNGQSGDDDYLALIIDSLKLGPLLRAYPESLSGGEQQRVAIARALAHRPGLVLADEPTGNLDERASDVVMALLRQLVDTFHMTLLLVTHSSSVAGHLSRTVRLSGGTLADD